MGCADLEFSATSAPYFLPALQYQTGLADMTKCVDAIAFCGFADIQILRLFCPVTCGCNNPLSGLYRTGKLSGCTADTCKTSEEYFQVVDSLPCVDMTVKELDAHAG